MARTQFEHDSERFRRILSALPDLISVLDDRARILYLNRAPPGSSGDEFLGREARDLLLPESVEIFDEAFAHVRTTGKPQAFAARVVLPNGVPGWYQIRLRALAPGRVLSVSREATEVDGEGPATGRDPRLRSLCAWCGRIKDEEGRWQTVEEYLGVRRGAVISHGMCDPCAEGGVDEPLEVGDEA